LPDDDDPRRPDDDRFLGLAADLFDNEVLTPSEAIKFDPIDN
jgi:hypothetical protein